MSNTYRVVWDFTESNGATFSEVYYIDEENAQAAAQLSDLMKNARLALLHPLNTFKRTRAANVAQSRDSQAIPVNLVGTFNSDTGPLVAGCAIFCILAATGVGSRKLALRGCPESVYGRDSVTGRDAVSGALKTKLTNFFAALQTSKFGMRKLTPVSTNPDSDFFRNPINQVAPGTATGTSILTLNQATNLVKGQRLIIGSASKKDAPSLNGHYSILANAGATLTIPYQTPNGLTLTTVGGYVRKETYTGTSVFVATNCGFDHMGTRDTKGPLSASRGAKRAARLRLSR